MNKTELIAKVAEVSGLTKKDSELALNTTLDAIKDSLVAGEKVVLTGFGTFQKRDRKGRVGRNPRTGEEIKIPPSSVPAFSAGKQFKDTVKGKK